MNYWLNCHQGMFMPLLSPTWKTPLVFDATLHQQLNGIRGSQSLKKCHHRRLL